MKFRTYMIFLLFTSILLVGYSVAHLFGFGETWYKLGLDLHGWVELDYRIDFSDLEKDEKEYSKSTITEELKNIVEKRVLTLGTSEPTIRTAQYGSDSHIIVQFPTQSFPGLTEEQQQEKNKAFVGQAKDIIKKAVRLQFKEVRKTITEQDRQDRKNIALEIQKKIQEFPDLNYLIIQYKSQYEGIRSVETSYTVDTISEILTKYKIELPTDEDSQVIFQEGDKEYEIFILEKISEEEYNGIQIFVDKDPSYWKLATTSEGEVLDEQYLIQATAVRDSNTFQWTISLQFNDEGKDIFSEITKRIKGQQLAIFVGGELLTAPVVQAHISNGVAQITGDYTETSAKELANGINAGIIPAPIYLESQNVVDPKLGIDSLEKLIFSGIIGFFFVAFGMIFIYRKSGFFAVMSLLIYSIILLAVIKFFGIVLTLASIAGLVLSLGIAIDGNILMLERIRDVSKNLKSIKKDEQKVYKGFKDSWSAIWDANITGAIISVILYIFGVNMIKGFGLMLGLGIIVSLFVIKWIAYPLTEKYVASGIKDFWKFLGLKK